MNRPADDPRWPTLALVLSISAVGQLTFAALPPVLPELAAALNVSRGAIGLVQGSVALPGILLSAYLGYLTDRFGRRKVVRASLALYGAAGSACFFVGNFWVILALRLVQGVGASTLLAIAIVFIGDQYTGYRRRWAMGLNVAAFTVTGAVGPIVAGVLGEGGAFRPFLLYLLAFPMWVAARRLPEPSHVLSPALPFAHLRAALADLRAKGSLSDFLGMLPVSLLILTLYLGLADTLTPLFLQREFGLGTTQRGLLQAVPAGATFLASALSGRVGKLVPRTPVIATGLIAMGLGLGVVGIAPNLWLVAAGLAVAGLGRGSTYPLLQEYSASAGAPSYRGVLVGTWVSANRVGMFAGPAGATALAASVGDRRAYLAGATGLGLLAIFWLPLRRLAARRLR